MTPIRKLGLPRQILRRLGSGWRCVEDFERHTRVAMMHFLGHDAEAVAVVEERLRALGRAFRTGEHDQKSLAEIGLSPGVVRAFEMYGIRRVYGVLALNEEQARQKLFGAEQVQEVKRVLAELGLALDTPGRAEWGSDEHVGHAGCVLVRGGEQAVRAAVDAVFAEAGLQRDDSALGVPKKSKTDELDEDDVLVIEQVVGMTFVATQRFDRVIDAHPLAISLSGAAFECIELATAPPNARIVSEYREGRLVGRHTAGRKPRKLAPAQPLDLGSPWFAGIEPQELSEALRNLRWLGVLLGSDYLGYADALDGGADWERELSRYRRA